ncbi:MAG TPA: glutathione S-transferase, partial [Woeseiaceae bacterium]|nr:glutathione S-transferase [Woeseiaceae bacterium]
MSGMALYGKRGWGSVLIEAQLDWYGLDYEFHEVGDLFRSAEARQRLAEINPIAQVPTLVMPDGTVMTESAAITLYLAELTGDDSLVPAPGSSERRAFLRWLMFIVANIYPTYTYGDDPSRFVSGREAQDDFRRHVDDY